MSNIITEFDQTAFRMKISLIKKAVQSPKQCLLQNVTRSLQPNHHIHIRVWAAGREFWDFQPLVIDNGSGM